MRRFRRQPRAVRHWSETLQATTPAIPTSTSRSSASDIRWTPVKNLTFSAEVQWFHLDQKMSGSSVFTATAPKPTALYEFKDQDTFLLQVRVQRNF